MTEEPTSRQESVEVRRSYVLGKRRDHPTASVEFRFVREGSDPWRTRFAVWVPWEKLDLPTALTVCQWLAMVVQQELQELPRTLEGGQTP